MTDGACLLRARGVCRAFRGVQALQDVPLGLRAGEVHVLMGQNGAGKSTLIRVLAGACAPDAGTIELSGSVIQIRSPLHAQQLGISTVYQEASLCPNLTVAENICAGHYPRRALLRGGGIDWRGLVQRARDLLAQLQIELDVTRPLASCSVAVQQMVAIARALNLSARVLILDEPTSSLDSGEVSRLFGLLNRLRAQGMAVLLVTHFLDQAYAIADRFTVLRNGRFVGEYRAAELPRAALIAAMVGRELAPAVRAEGGVPMPVEERPAILEGRQLGRKGWLQPLDIAVRSHEVLGVAGLLGSGRTELACLLFGLAAADCGELKISGQVVHLQSPAGAIAHGLALCPEERKADGVFSELSVRDNVVLALQARSGLQWCLGRAQQRALAQRFVKALGIKTPTIDTAVGELSGGNQQKVLLARALATAPRLLILDEPTRGIDVAAKQEISAEILSLAAAGMAVVFISSEIEEVVRLADRIVVMIDRRKAGELPRGSDENAVYQLIAQHA
jgi:galactofuranose transport system ATP-binding protein